MRYVRNVLVVVVRQFQYNPCYQVNITVLKDLEWEMFAIYRWMNVYCCKGNFSITPVTKLT